MSPGRLLPGCIVYPGDIVPRFAQEDHGNYLVTDIRISSHSGTHIDAPSHYLEQGAGVDEIPLSHLMGWCRVADLTHVMGEISPGDFEGKTDGVKKILLKTSFSGQNEFCRRLSIIRSGSRRIPCCKTYSLYRDRCSLYREVQLQRVRSQDSPFSRNCNYRDARPLEGS